MEVEQGQEMAKKADAMQHEARVSIFCSLNSCTWPNSHPGVNRFVTLTDQGLDDSWRGNLDAYLAKHTGRRFKADGRGDIKYHAFGFHYRGDPISPKHLEESGKIKEAYGVEHDGVQFVFLTLFRAHGCRRTMIPTLPYVLGLIPESVQVEAIPGREFHFSVYKSKMTGTDDFILEHLKRPSDDKWHFAHSSVGWKTLA